VLSFVELKVINDEYNHRQVISADYAGGCHETPELYPPPQELMVGAGLDNLGSSAPTTLGDLHSSLSGRLRPVSFSVTQQKAPHRRRGLG
jgi:hypothetical protein